MDKESITIISVVHTSKVKDFTGDNYTYVTSGWILLTAFAIMPQDDHHLWYSLSTKKDSPCCQGNWGLQVSLCPMCYSDSHRKIISLYCVDCKVLLHSWVLCGLSFKCQIFKDRRRIISKIVDLESLYIYIHFYTYLVHILYVQMKQDLCELLTDAAAHWCSWKYIKVLMKPVRYLICLVTTFF